MKIKAIAFDTGGTVLDWHSGLVGATTRACEAHGIAADFHAAVNDWRRRAMKGIVGQVQPSFNMDDVHRTTLDETLAAFGLGSITLSERQAILLAWHQLNTWSDFPPALQRLRKAMPVVSLTMLPTALVVDVSRRNGFHWDADHFLCRLSASRAQNINPHGSVSSGLFRFISNHHQACPIAGFAAKVSSAQAKGK